MKLKASFCLVLGLGLLYYFLPKNISPTSSRPVLLKQILNTVKENHFNDIEIDDDFSRLMHAHFLKKLDPDKLFFTEADLDQLNAFETKIDNELKRGSFQFFEQAIALLDQNILKAEGYCQNALNNTGNFKTKENFTLKTKDSAFAKDDQELETYWRKKIKYHVISELFISEKSQPKATKKTLQTAAIENTKRRFINKFKGYKSVEQQSHFEQYLNSFLSLHDSQSFYLTPEQKIAWDQAISRSLTGIGVTIKVEGSYPKIVDINSGGPAFKTGKIEVGDIILRVAQGDTFDIDTWGLTSKEILKGIKGPKGSQVSLQIQKVNKEIETVEITRDQIQMDLAMSFILENEGDSRRIGYLMLPRFYGGGEGSAIHVFNELELLKNNEVDGIVFDLRNNRGGYSRQAIDIMGYFLKKGVVMQTQARDSERRLLKDEDGFANYTGNLVVLVDSYSASASELFAGTMQDYNRGIIVGSKATFGKGSMQHFFDLDTNVDGEYLSLGSLKLTTSRFYSGCGNTPQTKGIIPDIFLPDDEFYIASGERKFDYSIPTEITERMVCPQEVNNVDNLEQLKELSADRVVKSKSFQMADKKALAIKAQQDSAPIPLNYKSYKQSQKDKVNPQDFNENIFAKIPGFKVSVAPQELEGRNAAEINRDERWIKKLERDPYVFECYSILLDCISS